MTPERHLKVGQIFHAVLDLEPNLRVAFLDEACGNDQGLRREVESLLASHHDAEGLFAAPALEVAAKALAVTPAQRSMRLTPGERLGPYQIQESIGAGGMGEVYRALDTRLNRSVAIKVLPDHIANDPLARSRFELEAKAAAALNHPHICTLHDIGHHDGVDYLVMEYVEGETLEARLARGTLPIEEAVTCALQAGDALERAHREGILHRDLKPGNIMLTGRGVKLLDFGLAKLRTPGSPVSSKGATTPGLVMGTLRYMSPEQARGMEDMDPRTDIFSLGVVLYEMLAGKPPFEGPTNSDTLVALLSRDPAPLTQNSKPVPAELQRIVSKALSKDREERYGSAREFMDALRTFAGEQYPPVRASLVRRAGLKGSATVLTLLLLAASVWYFAFREPLLSSVAVLPFESVGATPETEYLADGITERVISQLSKLSQIQVMSRSSVFRYKGQNVDPQQAGREMKVQAVLRGRLTRRNDQLEISVELVNVRDNHQLWGEQYAQRIADLPSLQTEIARKISENLGLSLTRAEQARLSKSSTNSSEAYVAYLKGNFYFAQQTEDSFQRAIQSFTEATVLDPNWALPYVGLANCYIFLGADGVFPPNEMMPKAKSYVTKALMLDETLPEAHASLGIVKLAYEWDWIAAEKELHFNLPFSPQSVDALSCALHYADPIGGNEAALTQIKHTLELDPLSLPPNLEFGCASYYGRHYDQAIQQFKGTLALYPNVPLAYYGLGRTYGQRRMYPEAIEALNKGKAISGDWPPMLAELAYVQAMSGNTVEGRRLRDELSKLASQRYVDPYLLATVSVALGETQQTFEWLNKAYSDRSSSMPWLKIEPKWDGLHSDARFIALLDRVGF